jgi:hypothetical protein
MFATLINLLLFWKFHGNKCQTRTGKNDKQNTWKSSSLKGKRVCPGPQWRTAKFSLQRGTGTQSELSLGGSMAFLKLKDH